MHDLFRYRVCFLAAAALFAAALPVQAFADAATPDRTISVSGTGEVKAVPDEATLSAGVVSEGPTADAALAKNRHAMNAVFATLKAQGIPEKAIQTSDFTVNPQYASGKNGNGIEHITSYRVSNTVTVIVDDLSRLGSAIDALVSSGANSIGGVDFTIHDPRPLQERARAEAVKDAMDRAHAYAAAAGVTLGRATAISEGESVVRPMGRALYATMNGFAGPTPVAAGENIVSASVSMTFEIQ